jgi:hypothetical protein
MYRALDFFCPLVKTTSLALIHKQQNLEVRHALTFRYGVTTSVVRFTVITSALHSVMGIPSFSQLGFPVASPTFRDRAQPNPLFIRLRSTRTTHSKSYTHSVT